MTIQHRVLMIAAGIAAVIGAVVIYQQYFSDPCDRLPSSVKSLQVGGRTIEQQIGGLTLAGNRDVRRKFCERLLDRIK